MKSTSFFDRLNHWIANSITVKLFSIGILILIMMIPMSSIQSLITERSYRRTATMDEISEKWGREQQITGLILNVPYTHYYRVVKDHVEQVRSRTEIVHILPEQLNFDSKVEPEIRSRGIYDVVVYQSLHKISGNFTQPDLSKFGVKPEDIHWDDAFISMGVPDMRGISKNLSLKWNKAQFMFEPGTQIEEQLGVGVHSKIELKPELKNYSFSMTLDLNGSGSLNYVPLGKETTVNLTSGWPDPSFGGAFLPKEREVSEEGFKASWEVLHLNRNFPQKWTGKYQNFQEAAFGVDLYLPVDHYQRSTRSAKYSIMFIALTFLVFFFVEIINKLRIHPIQYILVGLGLCLFYTLLLSLSEHIGFNLAYLVSSSAIIVMIFLYSFSVFRRNLLSFMMFGLLSMLYGFLFVILQEKDFSLLIGSVALFFILSVVMYISRNVNWYQTSQENLSETN